jgi:hypothetical protein
MTHPYHPQCGCAATNPGPDDNSIIVLIPSNALTKGLVAALGEL